MALFGKKKTDETSAAPEIKKEAAVGVSAGATTKDPGAVLMRPRLTEKGAVLSEKGMYAFNVHKNATKGDITKAVAAAFKVTPVSVRIVRIPRKKTTTRQTGKAGQTRGGKKAYVTLKEGDKIELV